MSNLFLQKEAPASSRREQRKQEFRDKIMEAAIQLFEKNGCEATTLEDICELAEISRPTFYSYYPSKKELIQALTEKLWLEVAAEITSGSLSRAESTHDYLKSFFKLTQKQLSTYDQLERELIRQSMSDAAELSNMNMLSGLTAMFEAVYSEGKKNGDIGSRFPVDFLAEVSMAIISTAMMKWAVDENYPIEKRLKQVHEYIASTLELKK